MATRHDMVSMRYRFQRERYAYWGVIAILLIIMVRKGGSDRLWTVEVDAQPVAWVESKKVAYAVKDEALKSVVSRYGESAKLDQEVTVGRRRAGDQASMGQKDAVAVVLAALHPKVPVVELVINGKVVAQLKSKAEAESAIEQVKQRFSRPRPNETLVGEATIKETIEIREAQVGADADLVSPSVLVDRLVGKATGDAYYVVQPGDFGGRIAEKTGVSVKELEALNPGIRWTHLRPDDKLLIRKAERPITVVTVHEVRTSESIPHHVRRVATPSLPRGKSRVKTEGRDGVQEVKLRVTRENGVETKRETISETVIREPVEGIIEVGSAAR